MEPITKIVVQGYRLKAKKRPRFSGGRVYSPSARGEKALAWLMRAKCPCVCYSVPVSVSIIARGFLRGDSDNYAKFVLDALQKARIIEDDRLVRELSISILRDELDWLEVSIRPFQER